MDAVVTAGSVDWESAGVVLSEHPAIKMLVITRSASMKHALNDFFINRITALSYKKDIITRMKRTTKRSITESLILGKK